MVAEGREGKRL